MKGFLQRKKAGNPFILWVGWLWRGGGCERTRAGRASRAPHHPETPENSGFARVSSSLDTIATTGICKKAVKPLYNKG